MDTLQIQDTFEPYFDGRQSFTQTAEEPKSGQDSARRRALRQHRERVLSAKAGEKRTSKPA